MLFRFQLLFMVAAAFQHSNAQSQAVFKPIAQINKEFLVAAHIVLNQGGLPEFDSLAIVDQLNQMNELFKPVNATFKLCNVYYVPNYQYNDLNEANRPELLTKYRVKNKINLYYVTMSKFNVDLCADGDVGGIAGQGDVGIVISKNCGTTLRIAHAFGHFFSLLHTNEGQGSELVNGSNCLTQGDLVCDTPADPFDHSLVPWLQGCLFINTTKKDASGAYYEPDISNLMGFYSEQCQCLKFTHGQYTRMAEFYLKNPVSW